MKIYPGKHEIVKTEKVDLNLDIPLAFIDTEYTDYVVNMGSSISDSVTTDITTVIPYTEFDSMDVGFYDKNKNLLNNTGLLQRNNDKYYYVPPKAVSFNPQRFNYSIVGKKNMTYKTDGIYNMKAACIDNDTLTLSKSLIKVFGDAPDRLLCPKNVTVNNKDVSVQSLTNSSIIENDFIFIESTDGTYYKNGGTAIDFNSFLNSHTNVWLSVDTFPYATITTSSRQNIALKNPLLYASVPLTETVFDMQQLVPEDNIVYHNLFNDTFNGIYIKETVNKGFVIMTPSSFLNNIEVNIKLFYEVLMYVFIHTYIKSDTINEWITDTIPDFVVINNKLTKKNKFTSTMEFYKLLGMKQDEVSLVNVDITPANIKFDGMLNDYITFRKDSSGSYSQYADPLKPSSNAISIFTPRQNVIFYEDFIYLFQDNVRDKIEWKIENQTLIFSIKPFSDSLKAINITLETHLEYRLFKIVNSKEEKLISATIYIVCKENILNLIPKETYTNSDGIIIAEIQISQSENESKIYDMRQRGGGIPNEKEPPFQSLLDVGHLAGMAYRKAGTVIITLPTRLKPFEEMIELVIKKHMVAEEFPIILFEDKEA